MHKQGLVKARINAKLPGNPLLLFDIIALAALGLPKLPLALLLLLEAQPLLSC